MIKYGRGGGGGIRRTRHGAPAEGVSESLGPVFIQQQPQHVLHGCEDEDDINNINNIINNNVINNNNNNNNKNNTRMVSVVRC